ncbi:hypothetical protein [Bacteroides sp.]
MYYSGYRYFPASGYRNRETGAFGAIGGDGYGWSSSSRAISNVNGANLGFNGTVVNVLNNNNRTNGFPIRCVQALTKRTDRL